jgi:hypothetical protein
MEADSLIESLFAFFPITLGGIEITSSNLGLIDFAVDGATFHQLFVRALCHDLPVVEYEDRVAVLNREDALGDNELLSGGHEYELEGKITEVITEYSSQYNNITVTMVVEGFEEYPVQAYRLTAEGLELYNQLTTRPF